MSESLPESVTIGPLVYCVTEDRAEHLEASVSDGLDTWGRIRYGDGKIILNPTQVLSHKRMSLLHEVLHGCWHITDRAHDADEDPMLRLSGVLLDTLRRNPQLVRYLLDEESS